MADVQEGKRVVVACMSATLALETAQFARSKCRALRKRGAVVVHVAGKAPATDVNIQWGTAQLLIYSPAVESGVPSRRFKRISVSRAVGVLCFLSCRAFCSLRRGLMKKSWLRAFLIL